MENYDHMTGSARGAGNAYKRSRDDLLVIRELQSQVEVMSRRLCVMESSLDGMRCERNRMIRENEVLRNDLQELMASQAQPAPGDICLDTEREFPKEYYANALDGLTASALELFSGIKVLACSLRGLPSDETSKQLEEEMKSAR